MALGVVLTAPKIQFASDLGIPLAGGKLYSYFAGTDTHQATFSDSALTIAHAQPVVFDSGGRAVIFVTPGMGYKFVLTDANDVQIWSQDNYFAFANQMSSIFLTQVSQATVVGSGVIAGVVKTSAPIGSLVELGFKAYPTAARYHAVIGFILTSSTSFQKGDLYLAITDDDTSAAAPVKVWTLHSDGTLEAVGGAKAISGIASAAIQALVGSFLGIGPTVLAITNEGNISVVGNTIVTPAGIINRITVANTVPVITGVTNIHNQAVIWITNTTSTPVTVQHGVAGASEILCPNSGNITLNPHCSICLWRDATTAVWRVISQAVA